MIFWHETPNYSFLKATSNRTPFFYFIIMDILLLSFLHLSLSLSLSPPQIILYNPSLYYSVRIY